MPWLTYHRFTDFLVNEIRKDGTVLHLEDYNEEERATAPVCCLPQHKLLGHSQLTHPQPSNASKPPQGSPPVRAIEKEDVVSLQKLLGEDATASLVALYERINLSGSKRLEPETNSVKLPPMERENRGAVHRVSRLYMLSHDAC